MGTIVAAVVLCKSGSKQLGSGFFVPVRAKALPKAKVLRLLVAVFHL
jgi:hypothetical protein